MDEMVIIVDTREQEGYSFSASFIRKKLDAGDYSIQGLENDVFVERKSIPDFVGTLTRSRDRFRKELIRLQSFDRACIVVEGDFRDILNGNYRGRVHPNALIGSIISIIVDYGIPIFFCSDRQASCHFVEEYLTRYWRRVNEKR